MSWTEFVEFARSPAGVAGFSCVAAGVVAVIAAHIVRWRVQGRL